VGGIRIHEPAADLAIALALASAARDKPLPSGLLATGEISLAGEIRAVTASENRTNEAKRLGFSKIIDNKSKTLNDAVRIALAGL
jgi:DNA repair protein RadA/Sms